MGQEDIWDTETAQSYDTEDRGMFAPDVLGPVVNRLAELAGDGRALEFAVGTGHLESRHADWQGTEFTAESGSHVSVYRLPAA